MTYLYVDDKYKRVITEVDIECLASHLGNSWRKVAKLIGFSIGEMETIHTDHSKNQKEQIRKMLDIYKQKHGHKAQLKYITQSLEYLINHGVTHLSGVVRRLGEDSN